MHWNLANIHLATCANITLYNIDINQKFILFENFVSFQSNRFCIKIAFMLKQIGQTSRLNIFRNAFPFHVCCLCKTNTVLINLKDSFCVKNIFMPCISISENFTHPKAFILWKICSYWSLNFLFKKIWNTLALNMCITIIFYYALNYLIF